MSEKKHNKIIQLNEKSENQQYFTKKVFLLQGVSEKKEIFSKLVLISYCFVLIILIYKLHEQKTTIHNESDNGRVEEQVNVISELQRFYSQVTTPRQTTLINVYRFVCGVFFYRDRFQFD